MRTQYSLGRSGFAALPDELFLEVLSHFPPKPVTLSTAASTEVIRRETLHSLSEVCKDLRRVFRPHLWQRVEVYAGMLASGCRLSHSLSHSIQLRSATKSFSNELLRQLNVVTIQDPGLAQCVRFVDIEVTAVTPQVFGALGRCFSLFPNLHTVKIITRLSPYPSDEKETMAVVKSGFNKIPYPQILSVVLSPLVYPLLAVCPNLESLITLNVSPLLLTSIRGLTALKTLSCPLFLSTAAAAVAKELTSLQQITITLLAAPKEFVVNGSPRPILPQTGLLETIQLFPNLRTLILYIPSYSFAYMSDLTPLKLFLSNLPLHDRPNLKEVIFQDNSPNENEILRF